MRRAIRHGNSGVFQAFTLAELLIALSLLGIITVFAIPKLLNAQTSQQAKAVFKESIAAIESNAMMTYYLHGDAGVTTTYRQQINAIKMCNDSDAEGCWDAAQVSTPESSEFGYVLANGATIAGVYTSTDPGGDRFIIDWNGTQGPNELEKDTMYLYLCLNKAGCTNGGAVMSTFKFGQITGDIASSLYVSLYN